MAYTDWYHEVSEDWLAARRSVITASELVGLIPEYKRQCKAKQPAKLPKACVALYGKKLERPTLNELASYKDAARGHIMEPYAVDDYNAQCSEIQYYHWDDVVIYSSDKLVGWSPDATDIPCISTYIPSLQVTSSTLRTRLGADTGLNIHHALEIKSYGSEHHMKNIYTDPRELPERYQLAVGFLTVPMLEDITLVHYNPSIPEYSLHTHTYTREDLAEETQYMQNVAAMWAAAVHKLSQLHLPYKASVTEDEVHANYLAAQEAQYDNQLR